MVEHAENAGNFLSFSKKGISAQFWYKKSIPVAKCVSYSTTYCGKLTKVFFFVTGERMRRSNKGSISGSPTSYRAIRRELKLSVNK